MRKVPDLLKNNLSVRDFLYLATFLVAGMVGYGNLQRVDENLATRLVTIENAQKQAIIDHDLLLSINTQLQALRLELDRLRTSLDKRG